MRRKNLSLDWLAARSTVGTYERVTIAAVVLVSILCFTMMRIVEEANTSLRSEIQRRTIDRSVSLNSLPVTAEEAAKHSKASQLVTQHNELVSVLEQLEKVAPDGVQIESISLNPENKGYRVALRTAQLEATRLYVDKLNNGRRLTEKMWHIVAVEASKQNADWVAHLEMR